jgi:hypothetical protein
MPACAFAAAIVVALATGGCTTRRTIGQPNQFVVDATINVRRNVDILVMMDNSLSTTPKQRELMNRFPILIERIAELAAAGKTASFHIGVVDSDLGAGPFTGACHPDGDGGLLRTAPAANLGLPAGVSCADLDLGGKRFIDYDSATGISNTGSIGLEDAFDCVASVGASGCGFEAPLEAVYRVLTTPSINPGFVRDDALLVVIVMTDEDDCSAPPDTPLFDPSAAGVATYGALHSFRCTQFGVLCDGKPLTGRSISGLDCTPLDGGPLFDVSRYVDLLSSGGVKPSSDDVIFASIVAPSTPFGVSVTTPCADQTNTASCPILNHSCVNASNPMFFGDPAVRINTVSARVPSSITGSICDADYSATMTAVADAMSARMSAGCLPGAVVDVGDPGCSVDVGGVDTPRCDELASLPCWDLASDDRCTPHLTPGGNSQTLRLVVEGAGATATVVAHCPLYEPMP